MKKIKVFSLCLSAILISSALVGCQKVAKPAVSDDPYVVNHSGLLDENGYIKGVKALDFVELGEYKNMVIPKDKLVVDESAVKTQIDSLLDYFATYEQLKEGVVEDDSTINIDYVGSVDGVEFEGGSTKGAGTEVTIGVTQYIDGFLTQLVGHKVGETFDINVVFPEDYTSEDLAGKAAVFNITINSIQGEKIMPELTDDFVKENISGLMEAQTVKELENVIQNDIKESQRKEYVWKNFLDTAKVNEVPQTVIDFQISAMLNYFSESAVQYSMTLEEYITATGAESKAAFIESLMEDIKSVANQSLIIQAVMESEKMSATDEDVIKYAQVDDLTELEGVYGKPYLLNITLQNFVLDLVTTTATDEI